jgi:hypothetical protein
MDLTEIGSGLGSTGSERSLAAGSFKQGNEISDPTKGGEILD